MASVLDGYLTGEATTRQRFVEERDHAFAVDKFEEKTRQFDLSFEESVRQFDEAMIFEAEQNALSREHQVALQDDQQEWGTSENLAERVSREEHQKAERAVAYTRIRTSERMAAENRKLQSEENNILRYEELIGDNPDFSSMPDFFIQGVNGESQNPSTFSLQAELQKIAAGETSSFIQNVDPKQAGGYLEALEKGEDVHAFLTSNAMEGQVTMPKYTGLIDVREAKEAGLQEILWTEAGGKSEWDRYSKSEQDTLRASVINSMDNLDSVKKIRDARSVAYHTAVNDAKNGSTGTMSPEAALSGAVGNYFYIDQNGLPAPSSLAYSNRWVKMAQQDMIETTVAARNAIFELDETMPEEEYLAEKTKIESEASGSMRRAKDNMAAAILDAGGDSAEADLMFGVYNSLITTGTADLTDWNTRKAPKREAVKTAGIDEPLGEIDKRVERLTGASVRVEEETAALANSNAEEAWSMIDFENTENPDTGKVWSGAEARVVLQKMKQARHKDNSAYTTDELLREFDPGFVSPMMRFHTDAMVGDRQTKKVFPPVKGDY